MGRIKLVEFGGVFPSVPARMLNKNAAQMSVDLLATAKEFRPVKDDTTIVADTGFTNPQTIYRMYRKADGSFNDDLSTGWVVKSGAAINYALGNAKDDTERTYYTRYDGSAAPRVMDCTGDDRLLGVPAPTVAPTVSVNVVDEFTAEDKGAELVAARQAVVDAIRASFDSVWVGAANPGTGTPGYLDKSAANGFDYPDPALTIRAYRMSGAEGSISDAYSTVDNEYFSWVFDPQLHGGRGQALASPAWMGGAGTYHWGLAFKAYGRAYQCNEAALTAALSNINMPGTYDGLTKAFTEAQVDDLVADTVARTDPAGEAVQPLVQALAAKVSEVKGLLDGGARASIVASTQAFYSKTDVAASIASAKQNLANAVWNAALIAVHSSLPIDYTGSGAASP